MEFGPESCISFWDVNEICVYNLMCQGEYVDWQIGKVGVRKEVLKRKKCDCPNSLPGKI